MALEISVRNSRLIKRPLSVNEIIGNSNWSYGTFDEHFRLVEGEADHGVFVVYDKDCIGRGVQFLDSKSSREIGLAMEAKMEVWAISSSTRAKFQSKDCMM